VVGGGDELLSKTLRARRLNWISIAELREPMRVKAKIRHRHEAADATIVSDGEELVRPSMCRSARSRRDRLWSFIRAMLCRRRLDRLIRH